MEASYRVDPTRRVLMGGSFGGLFTLYAMFSDPSLFSAYLAACPGPVFKQEADYARVHKDLPVKLYVAVGGGTKRVVRSRSSSTSSGRVTTGDCNWRRVSLRVNATPGSHQRHSIED